MQPRNSRQGRQSRKRAVLVRCCRSALMYTALIAAAADAPLVAATSSAACACPAAAAWRQNSRQLNTFQPCLLLLLCMPVDLASV